jgi:glucosyl-3-phosphoglycerate synthase
MLPQRHHHRDFADSGRLAKLKLAQSQRLSVCIPTLNEAATIGPIVELIRRELSDQTGLVDEILVIDSGSTDSTREIATAAGAKVYLSATIAPSYGTFLGKGENLWKALHVASGDLICYIDGDISNFHTGFVTGLVGPLLTDPSTDYVKAFYQRPLLRGQNLDPTGGGRVSEILVRPLLSLFYPELTGILQPLAGEYAARRTLLETLAFPTGYGVEIAHLIDLSRAGKLAAFAQTDLEQRVHRNRDDSELSRMAFAILRVVLGRLQEDGKLTLENPLPDLHRAWLFAENEPIEILTSVPESERPPVHSLLTRALQEN